MKIASQSSGDPCEVVRFLEKVVAEANSHDPNLAGAAQHALAIIHDIDPEEISSTDLDCLRALLEAIDLERTDTLLANLQKADTDCLLCVALKRAIGFGTWTVFRATTA